jgi:hypothetical protein
MMVVVAQEEACLTAFVLSISNKPINEFHTIFIVSFTVTLQTKMKVGEGCGFFE